MTILAIETSSDVCSCALRFADGSVLQRRELAPRQHASLLLPQKNLHAFLKNEYRNGKRLEAVLSLGMIGGDGAFPLNYPNEWDRRLNKTGSGIWLHGTPLEPQGFIE